MKYLIFLTALSLTLVTTSYGHGGGQTIEQSVGDYIIEVDYNSLSPEIRAQTSIRFDVGISNKDETETPGFTDVWVTIAPNNSFDTVFAGDINKLEFGGTGFTFTFPKAGDYKLTARFQKNGKSFHEEASFPLTVVEEEVGDSPDNRYGSVVEIVIGVIIGLAIGFFLKKIPTFK
ncbi:MAG: hypothetical protein AAB617_00010 [Patescibacteria group bacterium]